MTVDDQEKEIAKKREKKNLYHRSTNYHYIKGFNKPNNEDIMGVGVRGKVHEQC